MYRGDWSSDVCSSDLVVPPDNGQVIPETCREFEPQ
jgi:hypothetical protein